MVLRIARELKIQVSLQTKPFAGVSLGAELFYNIIGIAVQKFPNTLEEAWLDCGNQESAVLQAFETGCKHVYFSGDNDETLARLKSLALKYKARVRQRINVSYDRYTILELADISKLENQEKICINFLTNKETLG